MTKVIPKQASGWIPGPLPNCGVLYFMPYSRLIVRHQPSSDTGTGECGMENIKILRRSKKHMKRPCNYFILLDFGLDVFLCLELGICQNPHILRVWPPAVPHIHGFKGRLTLHSSLGGILFTSAPPLGMDSSSLKNQLTWLGPCMSLNTLHNTSVTFSLYEFHLLLPLSSGLSVVFCVRDFSLSYPPDQVCIFSRLYRLCSLSGQVLIG